MAPKAFLLSTEQISKDTSYYTIGFARLSRNGNIEDATLAGSGTLVTVGSLHGVLTAAHVVEYLPSSGKIGVILRAQTAEEFQKQTIVMEHTQQIVIRAKEFGPKGPDLGFLRLADVDIGWLKAKSSFYNLIKRRDDVLAYKHPSPSRVDVITGAIHEFTKEGQPHIPGTRAKAFGLIFCAARHTAAEWYLGDRELRYYEPQNDPGFPMPSSFEGTSGGGIWRFYVVEKDNKPEVVESRLVGVPFFQSLSNGILSITCHGGADIYGRLIDKIIAQWPDETKASA